MSEEWRQIPSFPNYEASSLGRIRRVGGRLTKNLPCILSGTLSKDGYLRVMVYREQGRFCRGIHTLVCEAFHGPCPVGMEAAHWDGAPANNPASNLRWATHIDNVADRERHGRTRRGELNGGAVLTQIQVDEIRSEYAANKGNITVKRGTRARLVQKFGVNPATINRIISGEKWGLS